MTGQAPTMDIVSTVPLCGVLISGAHASPLGVTANQSSMPLLVAGPSFPPFTQGPINMLPGVSISHSGAPGMQITAPALYSSIQSVGAARRLHYWIALQCLAEHRISAYDRHAVASAHSLCQSLCALHRPLGKLSCRACEAVPGSGNKRARGRLIDQSSLSVGDAGVRAAAP